MTLEITAEERARLVGLCARITGRANAAEDLAQEVLYEALRVEHKLRDTSKHREWLSGIARNVCKRYIRQQQRGVVTITSEISLFEESAPAIGFDVAEELERSELKQLLDRALGSLPERTRRVLVARLAEELPQREVADRLGMSEGAVAMRLERGKRTLRKVLLNEMPREAAEYGLLAMPDSWQQTSMWCPMCGTSKLEGMFSEDCHSFWLRCPRCGDATMNYTEHGDFTERNPGLFAGIKSFRPALNRVSKETNQLHNSISISPIIPCYSCGALIRPSFDTDAFSVRTHCPRCESSSYNGATHLMQALPEFRTLWRQQPRVRTLPPRTLEVRGQDAVAISVESVTDASRLDVVLATHNLAVLRIHSNLSL